MVKSLVRGFRKAREPVAYLLAIAILARQFFPNPVVQNSILATLGLLVLNLLFELHGAVLKAEKPRTYPELYEAIPDMKEYLGRFLRAKEPVSVMGIGMGMGHAVPLMANTLAQLLTSPDRVCLRLEMAMLDPEWEELERINPGWVVGAASSLERIQEFKKSYQEEMLRRGWKFDVYLYRHMPNLHGVLIMDKVLFLSSCYWRDGVLQGGDNQYKRYELGDNFGGDEKIRDFKSWVQYCKEAAGSRAGTVGQTEVGSSQVAQSTAITAETPG